MMSSGDGGEGGVAATAQPALPGSVPDSDAGESGTGDTVEEGRSAEPVADAATATAAVSQRTGSADELLLPPRPESGLQAGQKEEGKLHSQARDRDAALRSEGANAEAWQWFQELDTDNSGGLDEKEMQVFLKKKVKLTRYLNRDTIEKAFVEMDGRTKGYVTFAEFVKWFNSLKERERRQMRRKVRDLFESIDKDRSGRLDKAEFAKLATKGKDLLGIHPPFDLEKDWAACEHTVYQDMEPEVTYQGFEKWWKSRLGLDSEFPDIPVLPEFMVQRVSEVSEKLDKREHGGASLSVKRRGHTGPLTGKDLWKIIRPRILSIVRMQNQWGGIHQIYQANSSSAESIYESSPVPKWTRDPDSAFSATWDLIQVFLLFYVAVAVPLRAGFDLTTPLWSFGFFFDLCVDIYFVTDIVLNFRTAYYNRDGSREDRPHRIAAYYVRGWFAIDFVSCLPLSYISYFGEEDVAVVAVNMSTVEDNAGGGSGFRAMKALRLVRLSKMLRLARIKKILSKYGSNASLSTYLSIGFTVFAILFMVHLLTCFFYLVGTSDDNHGSTLIKGWVSQQDSWTEDGVMVVGMGTRYGTSTYYVLNALENGATDGERWFAIVAEFVRDFILGMVAGLLTTISIASGQGDQESHIRMRQLKTWLQKKSLPKQTQVAVAEYCYELWSNRTAINTEQLFNDVPPAMRMRLTAFLYGRLIANICLFRGLSDEIISALCNIAKPVYIMPGQAVIHEGQSGQEMYMILSGELEVRQGNPATRLGFLSEGSFFGEAAVLGSGSGSELRTRTVVSVVDSELCFLTSHDMEELKKRYPELEARLNRFVNAGGGLGLSSRAKEKLFQTKTKSGVVVKSGSEVLNELADSVRDTREILREHSVASTPRTPGASTPRTPSLGSVTMAAAAIGMEKDGDGAGKLSFSALRKKKMARAASRVRLPSLTSAAHDADDAGRGVQTPRGATSAADTSGSVPMHAGASERPSLVSRTMEERMSRLEAKLDTVLQKLGA